MLVPVQYQRLMALPGLRPLRPVVASACKFCTSAPFAAALKADVLKRWPGGLVEFYGMTEGGGTCMLEAHLHPDKLHTVGQPAPGTRHPPDRRGRPRTARRRGRCTGEVVGHSPGMMTGYHNQPEKTREAEWFDADGKRFIRTGDIGRFDADGFLILMDRKKDMIISGGFNIYPSDLEARAARAPGGGRGGGGRRAVRAVGRDAGGLRRAARRAGPTARTNCASGSTPRVGKTQRLAAVHLVDELPRSAIGKVLKRELRERHANMAP